MSLSDNKNSLFGKSTGGPSSSSSNASATPALAPKLATVGSGTVGSGLPPALTQKKLAEAQEWLNKGASHLKTNFFTWNPDYLAAAPCYENASNAYKAINEYEKAREALVTSAEYNEKAGVMSAAAFTYCKVAMICQLQNQPQRAAEYFAQSAQLHGLNGEIDKMADMQSKCAKEWEAVDVAKAALTYRQACERIFPSSTPQGGIAQIHPKALDIFREAFLFHVRQRLFAEALVLARRSCQIFEAFDSDLSLGKMLVSITLIQLALGDVVQADHTFLQEHLNNANYIRSKECAMAELFLQAFKSREVEQLDEAKRCVDLNYLDKDIQNLAKKLSVVTGPNNWPIPVEAPTASSSTASVFRIPPQVKDSPPDQELKTNDFDAEDELANVSGISLGENGDVAVPTQSAETDGDEEVDIC